MAVDKQLLLRTLQSLEQHQLAGEARSVAPDLIEKRRAARHRFHELINDVQVRDEIVADFVKGNKDCYFLHPIGLNDVKDAGSIDWCACISVQTSRTTLLRFYLMCCSFCIRMCQPRFGRMISS